MGRLGKNFEENAGVVYNNNVQYTKLKDEYQYRPGGSSCESVFDRGMPGFEGYLSFNCKHCGHLQILQGAELEMILGKSFKMAFRSKKSQSPSDNADSPGQTNIPLTSYPKPFQTSQNTLECPSIGIPVLPASAPPPGAALSSDDCNSPTQMNQFKRLVEKPSLIKRIGKGFVANVSDEEGYPLVSDGSASIPGSQSNISVSNTRSDCSESATLRIGDDQKMTIQGGVQETDFSDTSQENLRKAPWYQEGIPREIALEILSQEPIGSFMVRKSTTKAGCFALSVRVPRSFQPRGIAHYLIMKTNRGYRIKGFTKDFPTMASLIAHHSVMPELLPCPLSLNRYHPICVISDCRRDFADIQPTYSDG